MVLYNRRGLLAILHAAAAHCGQALTTTTDEVTLGCAGLPRHPQPHTTDPLPMVLHHDSNQFVLICRTEGEGAETRGCRETRTPPAPENTRREREGRVCSCPSYNTSIVIIRGHVFRRGAAARARESPDHLHVRRLRVRTYCRVRGGGKIGGDEHPLDCSAEKHCG